ncbi:MAG TPA: helicase-related protein, partial [Bacillota bacterium]|nr:helicase-related protein [Bacillota bacterium]
EKSIKKDLTIERKELRKKGAVPDILLMSATPIPRTLAISIYKDIDISFIKQKPEGRKPVVTDIVSFEDFDKLLAKVTKELDKSRQAYFICPKIAESETSQKISVEEVYQLLKNKLKKSYTYTLLHGKMSEEEKNRTLQDFYTNKTQILISTTVVEVGINVRNATVMVIMSANAFGLAQLHQLRGRIGRDQHQSYCFLVVDDIVDASDRLKIMKETDDGFLISEYDLSIRGPGEVFGHIQSGIPEFKMANLINDSDILNQALEDASEMVNLNDSQSKKLTLKAIKAIESYHLD